MSRRLLAVLALFVVAAVACAVPLDDDAQVIAQEELPERLQNTTTTTITTTTITPDTVDFAFYLLRDAVDQERRFVAAVVRPVQDGLTFAETVGPLFEPDFVGPDDPEDVFNLLDVFELVSITQTEGVATVSLAVPEEELDQGSVLVDSLAQLVWTLVRGFDRIDSVEITINDEPRAAPTDEGPSENPVTPLDYERYDENFVPPDPPTTTTTTSTTTVAPTTTAPPDE